MVSKAKTLRKHAKRRAAERYGIRYKDHRQQILAAIRKGQSTFVRRQSNRVTIHDVTINDETMRVVYDSTRQEIITFLPKEAMSEANAS